MAPKTTYPRFGGDFKGYPALGAEYGSHPNSGSPPFATITAPASANEGDDPAISATSGDAGLSLTLVDVSPVVDVDIQTGVVSPYATNYPNVTPGTRQVRFFNEANPAEVTSAVNITVSAQAPTISDPTPGSSITIGSIVAMTADGTADGWDANTTKVEFYLGGVLVLTVNSPTAGAWTGNWDSTGASPATGVSLVARRYWVGLAGETGTVDSASISVDLTGGTTPLTIFGAKVIQWVRSDLGITISTGVSAWADQSGLANDYVQAVGSAQPAYNASGGPNSTPYVSFDGADDLLAAASFNLPAPGTTPTAIIIIGRQSGWTSGDRVVGSNSGTSRHNLSQAPTASPNVRANNGTNGATCATWPASTWGRVQMLFNNATTDYVRAIAGSKATGINMGNNASTGRRLGGDSAGLCAPVDILEVVYLNADPSGAEDTAMDSYITSRYGAGLV